MVHMSTCYVNSNKPGAFIEEKLYDLGFDIPETIEKIRTMNVRDLEKVRPVCACV
jgi:hypothetical protein